MKEIFFVGNARCYHTADWFRTTRRICPSRTVALITDLIDSESHTLLVEASDDVRQLFVIDRFLLRKQSRVGDLWRNAVKLAFAPVQVYRLRKFARAHQNAVYHAHTMYYMFLCALAGIPFIGTPQGSEVLVRPGRSRLYQRFARKALVAASVVTVDSIPMQKGVLAIANRPAEVVQNGIDLAAVTRPLGQFQQRDGILSVRGFTELYRIDQIVRARNRDALLPSLSFIYPFWDERYRTRVSADFRSDDLDLGRMEKAEMVRLLWQAGMVVSIPSSDSSPRSVYEAIFAGAPVATVAAPWIDVLPACMRKRLILVDLEDDGWMRKAWESAVLIGETSFEPTDAAVRMFSQEESIRGVAEKFYV